MAGINRTIARRAALLGIVTGPVAMAGPGEDSAKGAKDILFEPPPAASGWSVRGGYAALLGVDASFGNLGGIPAEFTLPRTGGAVFGNYDDGFVRPDISGDSSATTFWSYENNAQYDPAGTDALNLSLSESLGSSSFSEDDGAQHGFEIVFDRELEKTDFGIGPLSYGLGLRFSYFSLDLGNSANGSLDVRTTTDRFPLEGVVPPLAPYTGSFTGPGPLLGTNASRTTSIAQDAALISGSRSVEGDLFAIGAGPWIELVGGNRFSLHAEAGVTVALLSGDYRHETTTTLGSRSVTETANGSDTEFLAGFYLGLNGRYQVTDSLWLDAGARYQLLSDYSVRAGDSTARITFDEGFVVNVGMGFRF